MMTQLETAIVNAAQGLLAEEALFCLLVRTRLPRMKISATTTGPAAG